MNLLERLSLLLPEWTWIITILSVHRQEFARVNFITKQRQTKLFGAGEWKFERLQPRVL